MEIIGKYTYDQIDGCIERTAKKHTVSKQAVLDALDPSLKDYMNDTCSIVSNVKHNPDIVLFYFSGSKDAPLPGHGSGETIPPGKDKDFSDLARIIGWRKMLSNFYIAPFELHGLRWNSVEHYYQGSKFKRNNPKFFRMFAVDSDSEISEDPLLAKSAGGKSGKSKGKLLRPRNVTIDPEFFEEKGCDVSMYQAMYAKFSQNPELKKVLLATKDATLTHGTRGVPTKPVYTLMKVRERLDG